MIKGVTVIICTLNGSDRLTETLNHVARQSNPNKISWEVILADNGSSDNSIALTQALWNDYGQVNVPLTVVIESTPGKLYALQKAIACAKYEYLIICDDDNWLDSDYMNLAYETLECMPDVAALGGHGLPVTSGVPLPGWFKDYCSAYAVGAQARQTGFLPPRDLLWGAGLTTRKEVYQKLYAKFPSFLEEHMNKNVLSAEDTEYCMRLILKGYKLYYNSSMRYQHFIPDHKLTLDYRDNRLMAGFKEANKVLAMYYAAMRALIKTKNRPDIWLALLFISPINYLFASSASQSKRARYTLYFLLPFGKAPNSIAAKIKRFIRS